MHGTDYRYACGLVIYHQLVGAEEEAEHLDPQEEAEELLGQEEAEGVGLVVLAWIAITIII